jgi:O6-methylguanine-DNA--protein-cysteine methyltransferase
VNSNDQAAEKSAQAERAVVDARKVNPAPISIPKVLRTVLLDTAHTHYLTWHSLTDAALF